MATNDDLEREYYLSVLPGDMSDLSNTDLERAYYIWALGGGEADAYTASLLGLPGAGAGKSLKINATGDGLEWV
jgi:hypothetical protein